LKSEPFHHTISFGNRSKVIDYHLTRHPDNGEKENRFFISYYTIGRILVIIRKEQERFQRSFLSGHTLKSKIKWDNLVLAPVDESRMHGLIAVKDEGKKIEMKETILHRDFNKMLFCPCILDNLSEIEGFGCYKMKGKNLHFHGLVFGFPMVKGRETQVLFVSKRQMDRLGEKVKLSIDSIIEREKQPERQAELRARVDKIV
jgi:hypothetical protein